MSGRPIERAERFFVRRENPDGRIGWVGPIRGGEAQADLEVDAWEQAGWRAEKRPDSPQTRAEVKAWERARRGQ